MNATFKEAIMIKTILVVLMLFGGSAGKMLHKIEEGARAVSAIIQRACDDVDPGDPDHFE